MSRTRFGILPPHGVPVGREPTWSMQRDVELVQTLDRMGDEEAWPGEHHHLCTGHVAPRLRGTTCRLLADEARASAPANGSAAAPVAD